MTLKSPTYNWTNKVCLEPTTTLILARLLLLPFLSLSLDKDLSGLPPDTPACILPLRLAESESDSFSKPFSITATNDGEDWNGSGIRFCNTDITRIRNNRHIHNSDISPTAPYKNNILLQIENENVKMKRRKWELNPKQTVLNFPNLCTRFPYRWFKNT